MTDDDELVRQRRGSVLVARLNRPAARNALSPSLMAAIGSALLDGENDPATRVVVLTGTGDRAFCAGMDMQKFTDGQEMVPGDDQAAEAFYRLLRGDIAVPVVGAANATAVAGGFELLMGCDVIVASAEAKFGLPEVKRGLMPDFGGAFRSPRVLPANVAREMLLTGENLDAARAERLGFVNALTEPGQALTGALALAARVCANAPLAVRESLSVVNHEINGDEAATWTHSDAAHARLLGTNDVKEGIGAFFERRPAHWTAT